MSYWEMGGYAIYVWPSYGMTLAVLALNIVLAFGRSKERAF
jgi:heme exporter protein CcmD